MDIFRIEFTATYGDFVNQDVVEVPSESATAARSSFKQIYIDNMLVQAIRGRDQETGNALWYPGYGRTKFKITKVEALKKKGKKKS